MKNVKLFLNKLSIGYKCHSFFIKVNKDVNSLKIVQYFYDKSWIKLYFIKNNEIIVYLRYIKNKPLFLKIKSVSTPGYRRYVTYKGLTYYRKNSGGHSFILLDTSKGLITSKIALNLKIGGEISYILTA